MNPSRSVHFEPFASCARVIDLCKTYNLHGNLSQEEWDEVVLLQEYADELYLEDFTRDLVTLTLEEQACSLTLSRTEDLLEHRRPSNDRIPTIHSLPTEVLSYILGTLGKNELSNNFMGWDIPGVQLQLVCAQWNHISLSTPSLWADVAVRMSPYSTADDMHPLKSIPTIVFACKTLLQRSQSYPLQLDFQFWFERSDAGQLLIAELIDVFLLCADRWLHAQCYINFSSSYSSQDVQLLDRSYPILQSLAITTNRCEVLNAFQKTPLLCSIALNRVEEETLVNQTGPFPQVTQIKAFGSDYCGDDFVLGNSVVQMFPNIDTIGVVLGEVCTLWSDVPVTLLKSCKSFVLDVGSTSDTLEPNHWDKLHGIAAQSVEILTIRGYDYARHKLQTMASVDLLETFITSSFGNITRLSIEDVQLPMAAIARLCRCISGTLARLQVEFTSTFHSFHEAHCDSEILSRYSARDLPHLEHIQFILTLQAHFPDCVLVPVIAWWGKAPALQNYQIILDKDGGIVNPDTFNTLQFAMTRAPQIQAEVSVRDWQNGEITLNFCSCCERQSGWYSMK
jgi:hypothetical protein